MNCSGQENEVPTSVGILKCMTETTIMLMQVKQKMFYGHHDDMGA